MHICTHILVGFNIWHTHSGHSGGVNGNDTSHMVFKTSTNGTSPTTEHSSPSRAIFIVAPTCPCVCVCCVYVCVCVCCVYVCTYILAHTYYVTHFPTIEHSSPSRARFIVVPTCLCVCVCVYIYIRTHIYHMWLISQQPNTAALPATDSWYGVAAISRLLKIIGLFCKRAL